MPGIRVLSDGVRVTCVAVAYAHSPRVPGPPVPAWAQPGGGGWKPGFVLTSPQLGQKRPPPSESAPGAPHAGHEAVAALAAQADTSSTSSP